MIGSIAKAHMSLGTVWVAVSLVAGVSLMSILQAGDLTRVSTPARYYFSVYIIITN